MPMSFCLFSLNSIYAGFASSMRISPAVSFRVTAYTPATHNSAYGAALSSSCSSSSSHLMTIKNTTHIMA